MPFVWTDGDKLGKPKNLLKGLMGAREICGQVKTMSYLQQVRAWAADHSRTAERLLGVIDKSDITIYLVGMDGGFTCFDSDPAPAGTIYINLNIKASLNPGGATGVHSGFQRLHPFVVFLHEVGHAVQYIETPKQFAQGTKGPIYGLKADIEKAALARGNRLFGHMKYSERKDWFSQGKVDGMAWSVRLEYDNMYRHERPICIEAGQPIRDHYTDIRID
jgi:hypothetical protein